MMIFLFKSFFLLSLPPLLCGRAQVTSRLRTLRMNLEQVPMVSTLLRAARDANELLLKEALRDILINGVTKEDLNSTDKSGRTAISYICSTNLTHFLDIFLQLPGIDINKPDNEGNTPLHFAAQAGQVDVVNMLLSRSRSIVVDAKNNLGFTPLMKAALQGRTKCAKLLLFAGASPVETDSGRGMRPEQWAKFCGRYSCAEMIEKCARSRLLEKTSSCKWSNDSLALDKPAVSRSRTNPSQQQSGGIRSKFRKVFPFTLSFRDKQFKEDPSAGTEIVQYLSAAALCASGPVVLPANGNSKIIKSIIRPLEVPKLEVTLANNMSLIRKYENSSFSEDTESVESAAHQPPTPRGKK
uniref:Putative 26s proteasome regulatory complex subunit psmd10 n=1 Tax=Lutzomyia longipalpis TaxID=7200 RepID=A0A7G3A8L6_LUTLO